MAGPPLTPCDETELCEAIAEAARDGATLSIRGGGSKQGVGRPAPASRILDMRGFTGVVDYDPAELVLTARAGTPLAAIQSLVASEGQMLAFEPFDHGPIFGTPPGAATLGGVIAAAVAGSQRLSQGAARDHLLGFRGVSGRAEAFVAGGKVVKNVTGYDLPKLMAGSWGRLAALTEVTLKVLPAPRTTATLVLTGLDPGRAVAAMTTAMGSQAEIAAAAHLPDAPALTAFRIQGFPASVAARCEMLSRALAGFGALQTSDAAEADAIWGRLRTLHSLPADAPLWRISVPPSQGAPVVDALRPLGTRWLMDWAGGLIWAAADGAPDEVRTIAASAGGHAALVRGPESLRARVPAFHPPQRGVAALEARVRRAFDPHGLFETGRF
ncbi:glycolate oxidase subunit GlcE [Phenylobacterium sp. LjRoot225]|uniref:glycolate oxidase subunit GlcE n=1 Tax=Phenylobacterium sp. LjRoot225 TaxID=3342285 RepID=UPI003ECF3508